MDKNYIIKSSFVYSKDINHLECVENSFLVCRNGKVEGIFSEIPEQFSDFEVIDQTGKIVIPGMTDLHVHAPQYSFRGLKMDLELMEWLNTNTFPEESKYADIEYANRAYTYFVNDLASSFSTRACIFATIHNQATLRLMNLLEASGLITYVGKVNSDRNVCDALCETAEGSVRATEEWILESKHFERTKPILTPRFTPSCTDKLMEGLGELAGRYGIAVQSHLDENPSEISFVKELCPDAKSYSDTYNRYGLFGTQSSTVMAHCVYPTEEEIKLIRDNGVFVAHCPQSNINLSSGIAPVRRLLDEEIRIGLGTDIAGGSSLSMFRAITDAIQVSKLYFRLVDKTAASLKVEEAFYLATVGGGSFFGRVGSFEKGYEFDALVLDDSGLNHPQELSLRDRFERLLYLGHSSNLSAKYVAGNRIL